jgi:hypothetical protein
VYVFEDVKALHEEFTRQVERASADAAKVTQLLVKYESGRRPSRPRSEGMTTLAYEKVAHEVRQKGGVNALRREHRVLMTAANTWLQAVLMLEGTPEYQKIRDAEEEKAKADRERELCLTIEDFILGYTGAKTCRKCARRQSTSRHYCENCGVAFTLPVFGSLDRPVEMTRVPLEDYCAACETHHNENLDCPDEALDAYPKMRLPAPPTRPPLSLRPILDDESYLNSGGVIRTQNEG